ncbi:connectin-like isoform X1 [Diorhabda carinulata]|uniref:connectin-like isoform X1 n=1 Tax=Diorhabda carinulata TaxID=1163345 RepID=UPI0025A040A1|nr:connectin-like isoform X1 [Diorhabda carinulata]XP_057656496.1 connectin-like isoform X1 [Diorhabda carinulata]XP_057656497.1 connectin-like isoform X1 [Diorhabda carinulata]
MSKTIFGVTNMKLATVLAVLWISEASLKELRLRKGKLDTVPTNICNLEPTHNDNIRCFCTKDIYHQISSAECWIFGKVTRDSFMWKLLVESQPYLAEFNVISSKNGDLSSIPFDFSSKMLFLRNLTINFGSIDTIERFAFGNSTSLQKLILSKNQINYLEQFSISNLLSLEELDLSENRINFIHSAVFLNLPQLKYVRLNKNNMSKIEDKAFAGLSSVLELDLSENFLCDINNLTFFGLSKLKVIDLSTNKIIGLTSSVFLELWDIEELYLDHNYIEFISNRAFDGLRFLKILSMGHNRLSRFPAGLFTSVFTLVHLDLSYNRLETLVFDSIEQFYNNLLLNGTVQLQGNRFSCDCRLDWIYVLYQKSTQSHIRKALDDLECSFYSDRVSSKDRVENLVCPPDLDNNKYAEDISVQMNEIGSQKMNLLSIPVKQLPCPAEYRPTPITVKQGSPQGSDMSTNIGAQFTLNVLFIIVFILFV